MEFPDSIPTKSEIISAHEKIKPFINRTPVLSNEKINEIAGADIYFKCENLQKAGAFKYRGATNAVLSLNQKQLKMGVTTHSSGNHAAALALAAKMSNSKSIIVMPRTAPEIKKQNVKGFGSEIVFCEPTLSARESTSERVVAETGATFIHPYDNYSIIAGQATSARELLEDFSGLNYLIAPVGGGGLLSGTALSGKYFGNGVKTIGAEPVGADDAFRSIRDGVIYPSVNPQTIADGLLTSLSKKTFEIINNNVSQILTVDDAGIIEAMRLIVEKLKIIIEPSSAVALAAILANKEIFADSKTGVILSGGNILPEQFPWLS